MKCRHDLIQDICKDKGISYTYEKDYNTLQDAIKENNSFHIKVIIFNDILCNYPKKQIRKKIDGGGECYNIDGILYPIDIKFDRIYAIRKRTLSEISDIKPVGEYKDSLGGGWYSMVDKYLYNGKEYADIECACY